VHDLVPAPPSGPVSGGGRERPPGGDCRRPRGRCL